MIVIDTSAICAMMFGEPAAVLIAERIATAKSVAISAGTYIEAVTVVASRHARSRSEGRRDLDAMLRRIGVQQIELDIEQARTAADGWLTYGRGSRQPSKLNLGDTFAYALAKSRSAPLLYVGDDFAHTDVEPALP